MKVNNIKKDHFKIFLFAIILVLQSCSITRIQKIEESRPDFKYKILPEGNSWIVNSLDKAGDFISRDGNQNWTELNDVIRTYFHSAHTGEISIRLNIKAVEGSSVIKVTVGNVTKKVSIKSLNYADVYIGDFNIDSIGYNYIDIQGVSKTKTYIGDLANIQVAGPAVKDISFIKDKADFYFGRRGPSVHLSYEMPENKDIKYFYNEITIPNGEDVIGSYFMANGFGEGYFGIQVNSDTERRILFSVWSPYVTDNPSEIPNDYKIQLLAKGSGVTTGRFGGEGSGGQSYKVFDWKAGNTYKFLLKGEPSINNSTDYTAYFYAPEENDWKLIASFRRPHTTTYLKRFHSFLENFVTSTGYISRKAKYANQWVYDTEGVWHEMTNARFTADATARKGVRLDYAGGVDGNSFYMENCGFFNNNTTINTNFSRAALGVSPTIDFSQLKTP